MAKMVIARVNGIPQPKGSTRSFLSKSTGHVITKNARSDTLGPWMDAVASSASKVMVDGVSQGPVRIGMAFGLPRPKGLRGTSPPHVKRPDVDKLVRAVLDALTGVVFVDDSQVVEVRATKSYVTLTVGEIPGLTLTIATDVK